MRDQLLFRPIGELGKIYASVGLLTTVVGMLSTMAYRGIYGATLDVFPSAFLLFSAAITMTTGFISFYLYTKRGNVEKYQKGLAEKQVLEEKDEDKVA